MDDNVNINGIHIPKVTLVDQAGDAVGAGGDASAANQVAANVLAGAVDETAPATDTASSGLNGRLQRIAQRLTSLIALVPSSLGQKTQANSFSVTTATEDQSRIGIVTESAPASDTSSSGLNGRLQRIAQRLTSLIAFATAATATITSVNDQATSVQLVAANANRRGGTVVNNSTSILYVLLGAGTASATNFTVAIDGKTTVPGVYFIPFNFTGAIQGVWSPDSSGAAIITEFST